MSSVYSGFSNPQEALSLTTVGALLTATPIVGSPGSIFLTGDTYFSYQVLEAETFFNIKTTLTEEQLESGIIELSNCPLAIFSVVKEVEIENEDGEKEVLKGVDFLNKEEEIGEFADYNNQHPLSGFADDKGLFGNGPAATAYKPESFFKEEQEQLFEEIIYNPKRYFYRADNLIQSSSRNFPVSSRVKNDGISKKIRIKTEDLAVGDNIYITYFGSSEKYFREFVRHKGKLFKDTQFFNHTISQMSTSEDLDIYSFDVFDWYCSDIEIEDYNVQNAKEDVKITRRQYFEKKKNLLEDGLEKIEGWRLTSVVASHVDFFWAIDQRGIVFAKNQQGGQFGEIISDVIISIEEIKEISEDLGKLFEDILIRKKENGELILNYTITTVDEDGKEILARSIIEDQEGSNLNRLFYNISEINNSLYYDKEKIPCHYGLVLFLQEAQTYFNIDSFKINSLDTMYNFAKRNVGTFFEDLQAANDVSLERDVYKTMEYMKYDDLLTSEFNVRPMTTINLSQECDEYNRISPFNYNCDLGDPGTGRGGYIGSSYFSSPTQSFLDFLLGFPFSNVNSFWVYQTPYYCDRFGINTRVYMEKFWGNVQHTIGYIYIANVPLTSAQLSVCYDYLLQQSIFAFYDYNNYDSVILHYLKLNVSSPFKFKRLQDNFSDMKFLLKEKPSFENGLVATTFRDAICNDLIPAENLFSQYSVPFEFDSENNTLKINPGLGNFYFNRIKLVYFYNVEKEGDMGNLDLFFPEMDKSILDYSFSISGETDFNLNFYYGNSIVLSGEIFKEIRVSDVLIEGYNGDQFNLFTINMSDYVITKRFGLSYVIFFVSNETGNLCCMGLAPDENNYILNDIIKIYQGDSITHPVVKSNNINSMITVFYILNNTYLMRINIHSSLLGKALVQDQFRALNKDDIRENGEDDSYLSEVSMFGKNLRRLRSTFVLGNNSLSDYAERKELDTIINNPLYSFVNEPFLVDDFKMLISYDICFLPDNSLLLIYIVDGKINIKRDSGDNQNYYYVAQRSSFHKTFINEIQEDIEKYRVDNIAVVKDENGRDRRIYVFYFCEEMLFLRVFSLSHFFQGNLETFSVDEDNEEDEDGDGEEISKTPPIFVYGVLSDNIKNNLENENLFVKLPISYSGVYLDEFLTNKHAVDSSVKPAIFITENQTIRIVVQNKEKEFVGITINSLNDIFLDEWLDFCNLPRGKPRGF